MNALVNHLQTNIGNCHAIADREAAQVASNFGTPLRLEYFLRSMTNRANALRVRITDLIDNVEKYRNPFQPPREGATVIGPVDAPLAIRDLCDRQVLPPRSTVQTRNWMPSSSVLLDYPGLSWTSRSVGSGGMGSARLYEQQDDHGNVRNRIVIKDNFVASAESVFREHSNWHGDVSADDWKDKCIPIEFHTQKLVGDDPSNRSVIKVYNQPYVDWDRFRVRIYMDYASEGDLGKLLSRHQDHSEPIPEKFVWLCFQALVDNCLVMKQGGLFVSLPIWSEIVHRDMKPENVFLDAPRKGYYSQWPTPKYVWMVDYFCTMLIGIEQAR